MGEKPGAGLAALDRKVGTRCLNEGVPVAADEARPNVPDHTERGRHVVENLADILARLEELPATAVGADARRGMHHALAEEMVRQGLARALRLDRQRPRRRIRVFGRWLRLHLADLDLLERQLELLDDPVE